MPNVTHFRQIYHESKILLVYIKTYINTSWNFKNKTAKQ